MKGLQLLFVVSVGALLVSGGPMERGKRLIKTSQNGPAVWMSEEEVWTKLISKHANFIDITDTQDAERITTQEVNTTAIPTELRYQTQTREVLNQISMSRIQDFVRHFSSYYNRYYQANTGVQSQQWLLSQVQESLQGYAGKSSVQVFDHSWPQKSIIARIEGSDPDLKSEVIILGAHQDSINMFGSSFRAPGADDNAAGSVVVLESLRSIVDSGFLPKRTIEFQWYAAEEVGLRGSAAIAQQYKTEGVNVVGMVNFDVPGYHNGRDEIGIYTDNTDTVLTDFLRVLVDEYLDYQRKDRTCGYGCSDHASWTRYGYASAMPAEVTLHPLMHTGNDNYNSVGFPQVKEFVKLALGVCVEFGEPANAQ